jgi:hypothetical protein
MEDYGLNFGDNRRRMRKENEKKYEQEIEFFIRKAITNPRNITHDTLDSITNIVVDLIGMARGGKRVTSVLNKYYAIRDRAQDNGLDVNEYDEIVGQSMRRVLVK